MATELLNKVVVSGERENSTIDHVQTSAFPEVPADTDNRIIGDLQFTSHELERIRQDDEAAGRHMSFRIKVMFV